MFTKTKQKIVTKGFFRKHMYKEFRFKMLRVEQKARCDVSSLKLEWQIVEKEGRCAEKKKRKQKKGIKFVQKYSRKVDCQKIRIGQRIRVLLLLVGV